MKLTAQSAERFVAAPDPRVQAALVFGPEPGLVRDRVERLARHVVPDAADPFRIADLDASTVEADPARLADELLQLTLMGGRRLVRVRGAGDRTLPAAEAALARLEAAGGDGAFLLMDAGELPASSRLRRLFEGHARAAAVPCYEETPDQLSRFIGASLRQAGVTADPDALAFLTESLIGDHAHARAEVDKLLLWLGAPERPGQARRLTLEDVAGLVGDAARMAMDDAVMAAADGRVRALDRALSGLFGDGENAVAILRAAQRHFARLHLARAHVEAGAPADKAMASLRPEVFFREKDRFRAQLTAWGLDALGQMLDQLTDAEARCKRTGAPDQLLTRRVLTSIALHARLARQRR